MKGGKEREYLGGEQKAALLEEHGFACALCGQRANSFQWDHIVALRGQVVD